MKRAFSVLNIKTFDDGTRVIRGIATTPSVDRVGDVIEPLGVKFTNPMPFLWQHAHDKPIGTVEFGTPTAKGIPFVATIANPKAPGTLKTRCDEAWQSITLGLVRAVSVGFRPIEYSYIEGGGVRYTETEVFELSAVTIPAQADAIIEAVKSVKAGRGIRVPKSGPLPVVRLGTKSAPLPTTVVRLTPAERRAGEIMGQALVRAAARKRLGIPPPVVRLDESIKGAGQ
jgi:HK97 family phage prohead protease